MAQRTAADVGRVLVVGDDAALRQSLAQLLRFGGHTVSEAEDDGQALEVLGHGDVSLLVLDLGLPGSTRLKLLDRFSDPPPVIVLSGSADVHIEDPRVSALLTKPFRPEQMLETVVELVRNEGPRTSTVHY